jgi:hypothetical protein
MREEGLCGRQQDCVLSKSNYTANFSMVNLFLTATILSDFYEKNNRGSFGVCSS